MKKKRLLPLLLAFLLFIICLFSFQTSNEEDYIAITNINKGTSVGLEIKKDEIEEKKEEPINNEVVETIKEELPIVANQPTEVERPSQTNFNTIQVAGIERPLMKDPTGSHYYLNHNLDGVVDNIGVPYIDFRYDFTGRKTIIYAHSLTSGNGPFQELQYYHQNYPFYLNHRTITIHYNNKTYTYAIFSVFVSTADSEESEGLEYFHRDSFTEESWYEMLLKFKRNSEYETEINVNKEDKILILQTCSMDPNYFHKYYRANLLVIGKLVSE